MQMQIEWLGIRLTSDGRNDREAEHQLAKARRIAG